MSPASDEEHERGRDVEDPDPLVVRRDEPARDLPALPGRCRFSSGCHSAGSPSGTPRALAICSSRPARADGGHRAAAAVADEGRERCRIGQRRRAGDRAGRCRPRRARPWHFGAHARPRPPCPSSSRSGALLAAALVSQASNSPLDMTSTEASIRACSRPQSSAHWPVYVPPSSASNHVSFVLPGIASILPPSAGIHHEWMTSVSGSRDLEADGHAGGRAHRVDRDDAVRILVLPVELAAGHLDRRAAARRPWPPGCP